MFGIDRVTAGRLQRMYPSGTRVKLMHMEDVHAPAVGTCGTVVGVDDIGTIHVQWDNGSCLGVVYGEDAITKE